MTPDADVLAREALATARSRSCWTAAELMQTEFPEPRFAVPGLTRKG